MTNVKYYMFWLIMFLALVFWLRGMEPVKPEYDGLGNELFTDEASSTLDFEEDPLF